MTQRLLLLDAGNSRLKWAVCERLPSLSRPVQLPPRWLGRGAVDYDDLARMPALWREGGALAGCYGVNVASASSTTRVMQALATLALEPVWLHARGTAGGVKNRYCPPESLGADRWMALLAARQRTQDAVVVVSAGSALTADALDTYGQFLGGMIVPGVQLMRNSLAHSTAQVGHRHGEHVDFPRTTADAVETGLMTALAGAVERMRLRLQGVSGKLPACVLTGGDADALGVFLDPVVSVVPELVLEGVYNMALKDRLT